MELEILGGGREVGRSCIRLDSLFLDCGIKLGTDEFPLRNPDGSVILTHAHLDHSGFIPFSLPEKIFATKPTRDLCQILWADYRKISAEKGRSCFSVKDMEEALRRFEFVEVGKTVSIGKFKLSFYDAGHILGSVSVLVGGDKTVFYTGDVCLRESKLHKKAEFPEEADVVICEATYGNQRLPSFRKMAKRLAEVCKETLENGGHVLIPVFAVGRAQEVAMILESYIRSGFIPSVPVFLDGMVKKAMRIYRLNVISLREEIIRRILISDDDPFKSPIFRVSRRKDRKDVLEEPSIIVTTSGMLTGGPALTYLRLLGGSENNTIILVGYQVQGTLGRKLLEGEREVEIDGKKLRILARVENIHISAHSDYNDLLQALRKMAGVKTVILVHGEEDQIFPFAERLERYFDNVLVPANGEKLLI